MWNMEYQGRPLIWMVMEKIEKRRDRVDRVFVCASKHQLKCLGMYMFFQFQAAFYDRPCMCWGPAKLTKEGVGLELVLEP